MRVRYDFKDEAHTVIDRDSIRLEYGGAEPDPAMRELHIRSAIQVEASTRLLNRLREGLFNPEAARPGTAAWEAGLELNKIQRESASIADQLGQGHLSETERLNLIARQEELDNALIYQNDRLSELYQPGTGIIEAPAQGPIQAQKLGYPDAPEGHAWVAGPNDTPFLRRYDAANTEKWYFDPSTGKFTANATLPATQRVGHGANEVDWKTNEQGQTVEVTATLREFYNYAERSSSELAAQAQVRKAALEGDHAGHLIGHRFVQDQGLKNLIPQNASLNTGAYRTLENELADWIEAGGEVKLNIKLQEYENGRPAEIEVSYEVFDSVSGNRVHFDEATFINESNQNFVRVSKADIRDRMSKL